MGRTDDKKPIHTAYIYRWISTNKQPNWSRQIEGIIRFGMNESIVTAFEAIWILKLAFEFKHVICDLIGVFGVFEAEHRQHILRSDCGKCSVLMHFFCSHNVSWTNEKNSSRYIFACLSDLGWYPDVLVDATNSRQYCWFSNSALCE